MTPIKTYADLIRRTAEDVPDRAALVFPGSRLTYAELVDRGGRRAAQLVDIGVQPGYRFGLLMQNCNEIVEFLLGAAFIGACAVPINTRFKPRELAHVIADAELTAVVTTGEIDGVLDFIGLLADAVPGLSDATDPRALALDAFPSLRAIATTGETTAPGFVDLARLSLGRGPAASDPAPEDPLLMMYTSGTTANPKGCVLTTHALVLNALAIVDGCRFPPTTLVGSAADVPHGRDHAACRRSSPPARRYQPAALHARRGARR